MQLETPAVDATVHQHVVVVVIRSSCIAHSIIPALDLQEQLATMHCLLEMNQWNSQAGNALTRAIIMVSNAVKNSLQGTPNEFRPEDLLQVQCSVVMSSWAVPSEGATTTTSTQLQHASGCTGLCIASYAGSIL